MCLDEGICEPTLLKGDILNYVQGLIDQLEETDKLVTDLLHSALPRDEGFKNHNSQSDFVHWTRRQLKTLSNLIGRDVSGVTN